MKQVVRLVRSVAEVRHHILASRRSGRIIGLVPTMGALHAGHARLIEHARGECQSVVVSVFINPLQFDREDDLNRYPRTLDSDVELCNTLGVDMVFAPGVADMYATPPQCTVQVGQLAAHLCGRFRPGHFNGVATVVLKLLEIAQPDRAYFGEKDAQQLAIIRRMVEDFNIPVQIVAVPTVRDADGLALSSRNRQLGPDERRLAVTLYHGLLEAQRQIAAGAVDVEAVKRAAAGRLAQDSRLRLEYLEIVGPEDMRPVQRITGPVRVAAAIWVGSTRLIDNVLGIPFGKGSDRNP